MKSKQWQEIKSMSAMELEAKLRDLSNKLFDMKFQHGTTPIKNGIEIRDVRRQVARVKTLLRSLKIAEQKQTTK